MKEEQPWVTFCDGVENPQRFAERNDDVLKGRVSHWAAQPEDSVLSNLPAPVTKNVHALLAPLCAPVLRWRVDGITCRAGANVPPQCSVEGQDGNYLMGALLRHKPCPDDSYRDGRNALLLHDQMVNVMMAAFHANHSVPPLGHVCSWACFDSSPGSETALHIDFMANTDGTASLLHVTIKPGSGTSTIDYLWSRRPPCDPKTKIVNVAAQMLQAYNGRPCQGTLNVWHDTIPRGTVHRLADAPASFQLSQRRHSYLAPLSTSLKDTWQSLVRQDRHARSRSPRRSQ